MVNASPTTPQSNNQQKPAQPSSDVLQPVEAQGLTPPPVENNQPQANTQNGAAKAKNDAKSSEQNAAQENTQTNGTQNGYDAVKSELSEFLEEEEVIKGNAKKKHAQGEEQQGQDADKDITTAEAIFAKALQKVQPAGGEETALPDIEPAAGEVAAPAGGGYGFQSAFNATPVGPLAALGALGATALGYNAPTIPNPSLIITPDTTPQSVGLPAVVVDETDLNGSIVKTGTIGVDFGSDGPGTITPAGTFTTSGSMTNGTLSSHGVPVVITPTADGYVGTAGGTTVFTLTIDPNSGAYTFTLLQPVDHADGNDANDVITINFDIVATDRDGDTAITSLPVNILDDVPLAEAPANIVDETTDIGNAIGGTINVDFGADGNGTISPNGSFDVNGSFGAQLTSHGVNVVVTPTANGYTGTAGGVTVFTFTVNPATGAYTFTLLEPLDHADGTNPDDAINLNFGIKVTDFDGDSDNGAVTITVKDDAPIASSGPANTVDETGLRGDGTEAVSGNITVDFGEDGPATTNAITVNGQTSVTGSLKNGALTSHGVPVVITQTADGYVGKAGATDVFKIVINPNTGAYTFTLLGSLDHADPNNPNDIITLNFGINAKDFDGDTTATSIMINVLDDSPVIVAPENTVDETDLGPVSTNGVVVADLGAEGGTIAFNGQFASSGSKTGGNLTSDGVPVVVTQTGNGFEGKANGVTIFTLTLNPQTSAYVFTLNGVLDHADGANPNDIIDLSFGVIVTDGDGSTATSNIVIHVVDDAPIAFDDGAAVATPDQVITGNVTDNDTIGNDSNPDPVININFKGTNYAVTPGASATIVGDFGVLVIDSKGNYTYTPKGNVEGTDQFQYTIQDGDSDTDSATAFLSLGVDGVPIIVNGPISAVDETDFNPTQTVTGQIEADFGADGPGSIGPSGANTFSFSGSVLNNTLTSQGQAVTVTLVGDTYVGKRTDGSDVFTLKVNNDGSYTFTAIKPLDHADPNNPDDRLTLKFGVDVVDGDGDKAVTDITVHWDDDAPGIEVPVGTVDETNLPNTTTSGVVNTGFGVEQVNLTINGQFASSGSKTGGNLTSDGVPVVVTQTANGYVGKAGGADVFTLTLNPATGQYVFTLIKTLDHADGANPDDVITLSFGVTATDTDGETASANINIRVLDDAPQAFDDGAAVAKPDEVISGNVTDNDTIGHDGNPDPVINILFKGTNYPVAPGAQTTITGDFGVLVIDSQGNYTYTPKGNVEGTDQFQYTIQDGDSDTDSATAYLSLGVDGAPIIVNGPISPVDETDFNPTQTVSGKVEADYGVDGPGGITPLGANSFTFGGSTLNGQLTSDGMPVTVTLSGDTYTGKRTDGTNVFTLKINNDGSYTFTALQPLDHGDPTDPDDRIVMEFGVKVTDKDGDSATTKITINWDDDAPGIEIPEGTVDETNLNPNTTTSGIVNHNFGTDGGTVAVNGQFASSGSKTGGNLTSDGVPVVVTQTANGYVGKAGGVDVFTLTLNPATGLYVFTLIKTLDHADGANPNDVITLSFGVTATDSDGETASANINIRVLDDAPQAFDDGGQTANPNEVISGNVTNNDLVGNDGNSDPVINVNFKGINHAVIPGVNTTIVGDFGTLVINSKGAYTYTPKGNVEGTDQFQYTIQDGDGDTDSATAFLSIGVDGVPVIINGPVSAVDETNFNPSQAVNGKIEVDFGVDGPGTIKPEGASSFSFSGSAKNNALTSLGQAVTVTAAGDTYTGTRTDGTAVFTLKINNDGTYTFTALQPLDHANTTDPNDQINLNFGVVATDGDGDPITTDILIRFFDDGPVANDDGISAADTTPVTGNVLTNDDVGTDANPNAVTSVRFGATDFPVNPGVATVVVGTYGTLTINANGSFSYVSKGTASGQDNFTYTITDRDGDTDTAVLGVNVTDIDDVPQIIAPQPQTVDETNLNPTTSATGTVVVDYGNDGPGVIAPNGTFNLNGLTSQGQPITVTQTANGYVGTSHGSTIFTITINPTTGAYIFTLQDSVDHLNPNDPNDSRTIDFGVKATDADGDIASTNIVINILDDGPVAVNDTITLADNQASATGNVLTNDDVGADANANAVTNVRFGNTDFPVAAGTATVIVGQFGTLSINANGAFTYTPKNNNVAGTDNFTYTITDRDGDKATAVLGVNVTDQDDIPQIIQPAVQTVDETNLNPTTSVTGTVVATYGEDGPGTITPNGNVVGNLTSGGVPVTVTATANGYVGTANGQPIFTLTINPGTGAYTFTLQGAIDHPITTDPNDVRSINFGVTATDADGDTASTIIAINILDDGPVAVNDTITLVDNAASATGNVLANDDVGADPNANAVILVRFNGTDFPVNVGTETVVAGQFGTLRISANGAFTYTPNGSSQAGTDNFTYTIRDRDGDRASAVLGVSVTDTDDIPQIIMPAVQIVDETNLNPTTSVTGTVVATYGDDGPGAIAPNGTFNLNGLTSQGQPITVTATANGYVGTSHGATIFTLTVNPSTGAYTFTLQGTVDHPNTNDPNDGVNISFGVKATDADGDTASTTIGITILDDGPVINDAVLGSLDETNLNGGSLNLTGTIAGNFGKDGAGAITGNNTFTATGSVANNKLTSNGVAIVVTQTADGYVGKAGAKEIFKISINATTGAYVFTLMDTLDHADKSNPNDIIKLNFGVKITDRDGDSDPGVITVDILDDGPIFTSGNPAPIVSSLDETGLRGDNVEAVSNKLNVDFGEDGGTLKLNGVNNLNGLTSMGQAVTAVLQPNGSYNGVRADGVKVFTLTLAADGNYTFTQFAAVDHADKANPNDSVSVNFGVLATDADGDTATTTITINILDDGPTAVNDGTKTVTNATPITGNVVANDTIGADATTTPLTKVTFKGVDYVVPATGNKVIAGDFGTLTIESDGDYSYVSKNTASGVDNFTYTIADKDGDTSLATFAFDVKGAPATIDVTVNNNVDDVIVKEDGSVFVKVTAATANATAGDFITLTLTGVQPGWNFTGTGWTPTGNAGEYKLTLPANQFSYDGGFTFRPPAQSDVDMNNLKVTAVLTHGATSATDSDTFNVITDAVVDPATLTIPDHEYSVNFGDRDKKPNGDTILSLSGITAKQTQDLDGSQVITKIIIDLNEPFKFMRKPEGMNGLIDPNKNTGENMGWHLNKGTEVSPGVWEILVGDNDASDELANLKIIMPREYLDSEKINGVWHNPPGYHYWEEAKIKITVHTEEINLSGREVDFTDNKAVTSDEIIVKFKLTPLVLDLDGDGIELTSAENGVQFDVLNNDGVKEKTGWVNGDDALLALDKNHDGKITNLSELFGSGDGDENGFANLASYDSNHDGVIDAQDAIWSELVVWKDSNHDGISDAGEMLTLDEVGIAGIRLNPTETDYFVEGNWVGYESTFIHNDGTEGKIADVWFELGADDVVDQSSDVQAAIDEFVGQGETAQVQDKTDVFPVTPAVADVLQDEKHDQSAIV